MSKILYVIPGYDTPRTGLEKAPLLVAAKKKGYQIKPLEITWARRVPTQWIAEASEQITEPNSTILGFSFGAFIAVALARKNKFKKMLLASLSPYYSDDASSLPSSWKRILGSRRIADATSYSFPSDIITPAVFFVGTAEGELVVHRVKKSYDLWGGKKKIELITDVGHDIGNPAYTARVLKYL